MSSEFLPKSVFDFLNLVEKNNNREWFAENKATYLNELQHVISFSKNLLTKMQSHDMLENQSGKSCLHRIYKDTRFSKDKLPYKTNWSGSFKRATKEKRGGYYFHLELGNYYIAGGFFNPNSDDLKRIRQDIDYNYDEWYSILNRDQCKATFGELSGSKLATSPKGFDKEHIAIDLLRHKQFILKHRFTDKEVLSPNFSTLLNESFKQLRPFFDHMSEILTTDANGISIL